MRLRVLITEPFRYADIIAQKIFGYKYEFALSFKTPTPCENHSDPCGRYSSSGP